jgi:hypothetical protein
MTVTGPVSLVNGEGIVHGVQATKEDPQYKKALDAARRRTGRDLPQKVKDKLREELRQKPHK